MHKEDKKIEVDEAETNIIGIYAYIDKKSEAYDIPFFAKNDINAVRKFKLDVMANDSNSVLGRFVEDFRLIKIGKFNIKSGLVINNLKEILDGKTLVEFKK